MHPIWDVCVIGGGATGLGIALDASSRGFKTILLEKFDFAKGTSSRSTKLIHGGVRYLQQGNVKLVMEALKERGLLMKNAPHLVHNQQFIVPNYEWWEKPFYGIGLKLYDWMAGSLGIGPSRFLTKEQALALAPTLSPEGLRGGIVYHDGQFDDARLAISIAKTAVANHATVLNYFEVKSFLKSGGKVSGVQARDRLTNENYEIQAKVVINATGVFTDDVMKMDDSRHENIVTASQGIHVVVDRAFLPGNTAIMVPRTDDGRVLFAVPWNGKIILGTTDNPVSKILDEPIPSEEETTFILKHMGRYLSRDPEKKDIRSIFAGLRPLVKGNKKTTAELSREHYIAISDSGLVTITGGKWTTYRKMAEDVMNIAINRFQLPDKKCATRELRLENDDYLFDTDSEASSEKIHPDFEITKDQIRNAVKHEMCMTIEDALCRRTRVLFLDAHAAIESAQKVAETMAVELERDEQWINDQVEEFNQVAKNFLPL